MEYAGWIAIGVHALLWFGAVGRRVRRHVAAIPPLDALDAGAACPLLCVFVPARNEEAGIERSVRSLMAQDYPGLRVVVANDHSTDGTGEILARLAREYPPERLVVFDVPDLPEGWMGKCHALHCAVPRAQERAELYVFSDADVVHESGTLRRAAAHMRRDGADIFSFFPRLDCVGFWENASLPLMTHSGLFGLDTTKLNDPRSPMVASIGAFILISRGMYERWGGHEAIRGEVLDDLAMGMMTKNAGGRLCLVRDPKAIHLRMYHDLRGIVRGFEKNAHTAMGESFGNLAAILLLYSFIYLMPSVLAPVALLAGEFALAGAAAAYALVVGFVLTRRTLPFVESRPWVTAMFYPFGAFVNMAIFLKSAWHSGVRGEVNWRGRTIRKPEQKVRIF